MLHGGNEFFTYKIWEDLGLKRVFHIDGHIRGTQHGAAQYMKDEYGLSIEDAYKYVYEITAQK